MNKIEFSKLSTKEGMILAFNQLKDDYRQLFAINEEQQEEIERLNNVINELEKWLKEENKFDEYKDITYRETMGCVLDELKELKEEK